MHVYKHIYLTHDLSFPRCGTNDPSTACRNARTAIAGGGMKPAWIIMIILMALLASKYLSGLKMHAYDYERYDTKTLFSRIFSLDAQGTYGAKI